MGQNRSFVIRDEFWLIMWSNFCGIFHVMVPNDGGSKNMPPNYGNLGDHQKVPYSATGGWTEWSHIIIMCVHTKLLTETVCPGSWWQKLELSSHFLSSRAVHEQKVTQHSISIFNYFVAWQSQPVSYDGSKIRSYNASSDNVDFITLTASHASAIQDFRFCSFWGEFPP